MRRRGRRGPRGRWRSGRTQAWRWPIAGLPLDVAHHAAAATWLGGLLTAADVGLRIRQRAALVSIVGRFSRMAMARVAVLVATGVMQVVRPDVHRQALVTTDHGRYLLAKFALLGLMLKVADINRRRVERRFRQAEHLARGAVIALRRAMLTELTAGVAILTVTAALVVSPPAIAQRRTASVASTTPRNTVPELHPAVSEID